MVVISIMKLQPNFFIAWYNAYWQWQTKKRMKHQLITQMG